MTFTVTARNNGPAAATNVVITDQLPVGRLTLLVSEHVRPAAVDVRPAVPAPGPSRRSPSATRSRSSCTARVETNTAVANAATLSQLTQIDINAANNTATVTLNPVVPVARPRRHEGGRRRPDRAWPANRSPSASRCRNNGPRAAPGSPCTDALPPGADLRRRWPPAGTAPTTRRAEIWTVGSLAVGARRPSTSSSTPRRPARSPTSISLGTVRPDATPTPTNNSASAAVVVRTPVADLPSSRASSPSRPSSATSSPTRSRSPTAAPTPVRGVYVTDTGPTGVTVLVTAATQGTVEPGDAPLGRRHSCAGDGTARPPSPRGSTPPAPRSTW